MVLDSNGDENLDAMRGVAVLVLEGGYLAFTGGSSRMAGYCAIWSVGSNNCITYGKNMHAVSNATGNELSMVYYEDTYTDETGTWTDQIYWFEEDNLVTYPEGDEEYDESQLSHDVTISSEKGSAVINSAAVELSVTNGAPAQGAKMSVRAIISILEGGHADVAVTMPVGMEPLADSIYLDNQKLESLEDIQITGPAVLRFDVVPVNRFEQTIGVKVFNDSQTEIGQSTLRFLPGEFDASAPSHVETPTVTITGKAHPGYTVKVSDVNNNVVSAQVNELGYYSVTFNALVPGENSLRIFLNDVYMKDVNVLYEEVQVRIESLTIRNNVHNSYGETVEEFVKILYPNGTPTRKFYTYWPGQDLFTLEVNIPGAPDNMVLKVIITDYDGREYEVVLTEIRDGFYKGYYLNEDPNSPPVGFEVHWLRITQINEGEEEEGHTVKTEIIPIMDPSGFVYEDVESNRVEGARVTLERGEMSDGQIQYTGDWDAESYGQINGYLTNVNGEFQWDVPKGFWRVRVEKDGYAVTYSDWMEVPPPQLGVAIDIGPSRLAENKAALYETVQIVEDGHQAVVSFTQPVLFSKVENALVITDENGEYLEGQIRIGQVLGQSSQGNLVKQVIFDTDMPMEHVEVRFAEHAGSAFQKDSAASGSFRPLEITGLVKQGGKVGVVLHYGSRSVMRETLIVASYDAQGRFLSMTSAVAVNGNNEVACDPNAVTVKAFVVESMETMIPLCEAASNG